MMMSAGAASLTTLAVAVAVPAIGDDGKDAGKGAGVTVIQAGPSPERLRACLKDHGMDVPDGDPIALKRWLGAHFDDAATADALKACDMGPVPKPADVTCAVVKPGVPADGAKRAFKVRIAPPRERGLRTDGE
jgi:hypothetical protein